LVDKTQPILCGVAVQRYPSHPQDTARALALAKEALRAEILRAKREAATAPPYKPPHEDAA
jgi:hypothetical protein